MNETMKVEHLEENEYYDRALKFEGKKHQIDSTIEIFEVLKREDEYIDICDIWFSPSEQIAGFSVHFGCNWKHDQGVKHPD